MILPQHPIYRKPFQSPPRSKSHRTPPGKECSRARRALCNSLCHERLVILHPTLGLLVVDGCRAIVPDGFHIFIDRVEEKVRELGIALVALLEDLRCGKGCGGKRKFLLQGSDIVGHAPYFENRMICRIPTTSITRSERTRKVTMVSKVFVVE